MAPSHLPGDFSESAAYPLYAIDPPAGRAWIIHFDREDYRRASFLDQRALGHRPVSGWVVSAPELQAASRVPGPSERLHWLFHIGHCGSSLVSRLLDLLPGVLGIREPLPLLTLAHDRTALPQWLPPVRGLLARGFRDTEAVVVKPTSIVTTLADQLVPGTGRACLLWVDLHTWLATMFRDESLVNATLATEHLRLRTLHLAEAETVGTRLARAWLAQQLEWMRLREHGDARQLLDLDFADVIAAPPAALARLAQHFSLQVPSDLEGRIATSGILDRYAKDASQAFDADMRRRELEASSRQHTVAIAEGMRWASKEIERLGAATLLTRLLPADQ